MLIDQPGPISFEGKYVRFKDAEMNPRPQGLSLWYAGTSDIAIKRTARYCEGWWPAGSPDYFRRKISELRREAERVSRGDVLFEIGTSPHTYIAATDQEAWDIARKTIEAHSQSEWMQRHDSSAQSQTELVGSSETVAAKVRQYQAAGVTMFRLSLIGHSLEALLEQMELFADEVIPLTT